MLLPPFSEQSAIQKVRMAEDAWNSRDPQRVSQVYSLETRWRNRSENVQGATRWWRFSAASGRKSSITV